MSKPIHPATVHFPLTLLILTYLLDILHFTHANLPATLVSAMPSPSDLSRLSHGLLTLGLLTAFPALASGIQQAVLLVNKTGLYESDKKTLRPKIKTTLAHAAANDIVLAVSGYIWYAPRGVGAEGLTGKLGLGGPKVPELWMVGLEVALLGLLGFAANLGGMLTYNHGVGLSVGGGVGGKKKV